MLNIKGIVCYSVVFIILIVLFFINVYEVVPSFAKPVSMNPEDKAIVKVEIKDYLAHSPKLAKLKPKNWKARTMAARDAVPFYPIQFDDLPQSDSPEDLAKAFFNAKPKYRLQGNYKVDHVERSNLLFPNGYIIEMHSTNWPFKELKKTLNLKKKVKTKPSKYKNWKVFYHIPLGVVEQYRFGQRTLDDEKILPCFSFWQKLEDKKQKESKKDSKLETKQKKLEILEKDVSQCPVIVSFEAPSKEKPGILHVYDPTGKNIKCGKFSFVQEMDRSIEKNITKLKTEISQLKKEIEKLQKLAQREKDPDKMEIKIKEIEVQKERFQNLKNKLKDLKERE